MILEEPVENNFLMINITTPETSAGELLDKIMAVRRKPALFSDGKAASTLTTTFFRREAPRRLTFSICTETSHVTQKLFEIYLHKMLYAALEVNLSLSLRSKFY